MAKGEHQIKPIEAANRQCTSKANYMKHHRRYDYDFRETYKRIARAPSEWAMDIRHVKLLYNLLRHAPIRTYAEIGCYAGVSTTAAIEALKAKKDLHVHLCDVHIQPTIVEMAREWIMRRRLSIFCGSSVNFLQSLNALDFILLDGDHSLATVQKELSHLARLGVKYVAAHDTSALSRIIAHGIPTDKYNGPAYLQERLQFQKDWYCLEERRHRSHEETARGFFFATTDFAFFQVAQVLFRYWSDVPYKVEYSRRFRGRPKVTSSTKGNRCS